MAERISSCVIYFIHNKLGCIFTRVELMTQCLFLIGDIVIHNSDDN